MFIELEEDDEDDYNVDLESRQEQSEKDKYLDHKQENGHNKEQGANIRQDEDLKRGRRVKRQSDYEYTPTKTRCPLLLVADYRFFQEMGASNTKSTISYLVRFI